jgi:hypothetical protein
VLRFLAAAPNLCGLIFEECPQDIQSLLSDLIPFFIQRRSVNRSTPLIVRIIITTDQAVAFSNLQVSTFKAVEMERFICNYGDACCKADGHSVVQRLTTKDFSVKSLRNAPSPDSLPSIPFVPCLQLQFLLLSDESSSSESNDTPSAFTLNLHAFAEYSHFTQPHEFATCNVWQVPPAPKGGEYDLRPELQLMEIFKESDRRRMRAARG